MQCCQEPFEEHGLSSPIMNENNSPLEPQVNEF